MKKEYSLTAAKKFDVIIQKGKKIRSKFLFISYIESKEFKIGISIPKKLGNAVFRNKNKRRIKNIIQEIKPYSLNKHIVLIAKKEFTELSFKKQKEEIYKSLSNIGLWQ